MFHGEVSLEGIPGPSHSFSGLAYGDLAAMASAGKRSNPRAAARQCLQKINLLTQRGVPALILPPHERPAIWFLRSIGYQGADPDVLGRVAESAPWLLPIIYSSSGMWSANSATVVPTIDTDDQQCRVIVANLAANLHRSLEPAFTLRVLKRMLPESAGFSVLPGIPSDVNLWDEGAANHVLISTGGAGVHLFAYGRRAGQSFSELLEKSDHLFGRQTNEASSAVARLSKVLPDRMLLVQQNQEVIDHGVFHNDVICMSAGPFLIIHELAFDGWSVVRDKIVRRAELLGVRDIHIFEVGNHEISVDECVRTYLFNSQIIVLPDRELLMIFPSLCRESSQAQLVIDRLSSEINMKVTAEFVDLSESLANGGGPACLRLRVQMTEDQFRAISHQPFVATDSVIELLAECVERRYRESLTLDDLKDPVFMEECQQSLDEISRILGYGSIYSFQTSAVS